MHTTRRLPGLLAVSMLAGAGMTAAAVSSAYRSDLRAARARLSGRSRVVLTADEPIEVAESGSGPPVLVVHGTAGGFDMGLDVGRDVAGDSFRIIAPSRFGYLRTPLPAHASHASQADAFAALLDALEVDRAAVIAVSAGAQSATQLALRHPDRVGALVLITPALYLPPGPGTPDAGPPDFVIDQLLASDFLTWAVVRAAPGLMVRVAGVPKALDDRVTPEFRRQVTDWFFPASARHLGLAHDIRTTTPVAPDLPIEELRMPVMMVSADDDPYLTADVVRYSATRLPTAEVVIYDSGGHVLIGQEEAVRRDVRAFLASARDDRRQLSP